MTTVDAANVHNIAIEGTFDDCQDLVKALFNDQQFRDRHRLAAVNSINWARVAAQIVYYMHAGLKLGAPERTVSFAVPTGNFGNVLAGWAARQMGLPIRRLLVGSNRNDILVRFFASGRMEIGDVFTTLSPSMDIQVSSNFERYLFELYDRDAVAIATMMKRLRDERRFVVDDGRLATACELFDAVRCDDEETKRVIREVHAESGRLIDPHTAIGVAAARKAGAAAEGPIVAIATAHPAKFPDAVEAATGVRPVLPEPLADLLTRVERYDVLPVDLERLRATIADRLNNKD